MIVLEVELALLVFAVVALAAIFLVVHRESMDAHRELLDKVYERQKAMDGYVKAVTRDKLVVLRKADDALAESQAVREEARVSARKLEQHLSDPRVRRLTDG